MSRSITFVSTCPACGHQRLQDCRVQRQRLEGKPVRVFFAQSVPAIQRANHVRRAAAARHK